MCNLALNGKLICITNPRFKEYCGGGNRKNLRVAGWKRIVWNPILKKWHVVSFMNLMQLCLPAQGSAKHKLQHCLWRSLGGSTCNWTVGSWWLLGELHFFFFFFGMDTAKFPMLQWMAPLSCEIWQ